MKISDALEYGIYMTGGWGVANILLLATIEIANKPQKVCDDAMELAVIPMVLMLICLPLYLFAQLAEWFAQP